MLGVTLDNLEHHKNEIKKLLGDDFINEIESMNAIGLSWMKALETRAKFHPFATWWQSFKKDIEKSKSRGSLLLSQRSHLLLNMLSHLRVIETLPNIERIIKSIKDRSTFYSAIFEVFVASAYHIKGYEVEIVKERPNTAEKTCDFRIKIGGQTVYIECKSLEDFSIKETRKWEELFGRIHKSLDRHHRNWNINILSGKQIDHKDSDFIYAECVANIRNNNLGKMEISGGEFIIECSKISEWEEELEGSLNIPTNCQLLSCQISTRASKNKVIAKNPRIIGVSPHFEGDIAPRLISEFKTATKQIPKLGPGIIHLAIPYKKGSQLIEVVDKSYYRIHRKLNKDSKRVNAVVISGVTIDEKSKTSINYIHNIVPNLNTRSRLPSGFSILGSNDTGIVIPDNEGKVEIGFGFYQEFMGVDPPTYVLYDHSSNDGRYQLKIWKTWNDSFRFELFTPKLGRIYVDSNLIELDKREKHSFAARWNKNIIELFHDGLLIGHKMLNEIK